VLAFYDDHCSTLLQSLLVATLDAAVGRGTASLRRVKKTSSLW